MQNYEKLYHLLFNAITDALEKVESGEPETARFLLIRAQQEAEGLDRTEGEEPAPGL